MLYEKPLASTVEDADAMVKAADASGLVAACGFSYRRSPAVSAIAEQIKAGELGEIQHFNGRYWCDYSADPDAPTSWRYEGPRGSGALADLGSHLVDLSEQLCGPIIRIDGAALPILIKAQPVPLGAALGHAAGGAVSDERAAQSMPFSGIGHRGQEVLTYQARAFLDEIAGLDRLPRQATFADGLRNMRVEEAIVKSAATGAAVMVPR